MRPRSFVSALTEASWPGVDSDESTAELKKGGIVSKVVESFPCVEPLLGGVTEKGRF